MKAIPHSFKSLREGDRLPLIIIGAGMSKNICPLVDELVQICPDAEEKLSLKICLDKNNNDPGYLYFWAEEAIKILTENNDPCPKLTLAVSLGMTSDARWLGNMELDLRQNTPRHRVIARFARENRWKALWSLNWDCLLEVALESVGFRRGEQTTEQPWRTAYATYTTREDFAGCAKENVLSVIKPHGCVKDLIKAEELLYQGKIPEAKIYAERFRIAHDELNTPISTNNPHDQGFQDKLKDQIRGNPLIIAGWSVSETYLYDIIKNALDYGPPDNEDELSVIDICFNNNGHKDLTELYKRNKDDVFFQVDKGSAGISTDSLFLWIQALYALGHLRNNYKHDILDAIVKKLKEPQKPNSDQHFDFVIDWVDNFLPVWVRLCWRAGQMQPYVINGEQFKAHAIRIDRRDEHIPWYLPGPLRTDLQAAAKILIALWQNNQSWDVRSFPGGLWKEPERLLVIPLPAWESLKDPHSLHALKPLLDSLKENLGLGYIRKIKIIPVMYNSSAPEENAIRVLKASLARLLPFLHFADIDALKDVDLSYLKGGS